MTSVLHFVFKWTYFCLHPLGTSSNSLKKVFFASISKLLYRYTVPFLYSLLDYAPLFHLLTLFFIGFILRSFQLVSLPINTIYIKYSLFLFSLNFEEWIVYLELTRVDTSISTNFWYFCNMTFFAHVPTCLLREKKVYSLKSLDIL